MIEKWTRPSRDIAERVKQKLASASEAMEFDKANLGHMHALLDAIESGREFRRHPIAKEEILAAYAATGRVPKVERDAGEDWEEDKDDKGVNHGPK